MLGPALQQLYSDLSRLSDRSDYEEAVFGELSLMFRMGTVVGAPFGDAAKFLPPSPMRDYLVAIDTARYQPERAVMGTKRHAYLLFEVEPEQSGMLGSNYRTVQTEGYVFSLDTELAVGKKPALPEGNVSRVMRLKCVKPDCPNKGL